VAALVPVALIGLDWGSTHLRAFAFDAQGNVIDRAESAAGALSLSGAAQFDAALTAIVGRWARSNPAAPLIACGMVGAKSGWRDAGYAPLDHDHAHDHDHAVIQNQPAAALAARIVQVPTSLGRPLAIIPGLNSSEPDVMRGEETQLVGAGVTSGMVVLPGTHCKWVHMSGGRVASFATFYTGEMNALIRQHSSVGAVIKSEPQLDDLAAFETGLNYARAGAATWLHDLFVLRASVVTGERSESFVSTALAGWLLGCEISAAIAMYPETRSVSLVASARLVPWYEAATRAFAISCDALNAETASARGLWAIATMAVGRSERGP
jgi:2-dehydro-3-deoxygalactonokinase